MDLTGERLESGVLCDSGAIDELCRARIMRCSRRHGTEVEEGQEQASAQAEETASAYAAKHLRFPADLLRALFALVWPWTEGGNGAASARAAGPAREMHEIAGATSETTRSGPAEGTVLRMEELGRNQGKTAL